MTVYGKTTGEHTFNIYVKNAEGKWCYRDFTIRVGNSSKLAYKGTKSVDRQQHSDYKDVPESVNLDFVKMLEIRIESNVSGISTVIFSAPIWCKFKHRKF